MSKFAKDGTTVLPTGSTATKTKPKSTHEGGTGYRLEDKTALFTLAVSSFIGGENTFYESGGKRDARFVKLIEKVMHDDPAWLAGFIPWLRDEANMRTASVVAGVEYARLASILEPTVSGRNVLARSLQRADEPAEALAYFMQTYGRTLPAAVKRGIADAATRLYSEYAVAKYDSSSNAVRIGDVIELTHPRPHNRAQADLFMYLLDKRHGRTDPRMTDALAKTRALVEWHKSPDVNALPALITWEQLSSHTKMDARAWEAVIPNMGYMALLRNLRNFQEAGVSGETLDLVARKLADVEEVTRSRQLPFRFYSAYMQVHGTRFAHPLEVAFERSVANIPRLRGHTLVLVDTSGSMQNEMSGKSQMQRVQAAGLFGYATAAMSDSSEVWQFASTAQRVNDWERDGSVLRSTERLMRRVGQVGHGTDISQALVHAWAQSQGKPARIFLFTDMQAHPSQYGGVHTIPKDVPIHVWDLAGYRTANLELGAGRYLHGGLSDQTFKVVKLLEEYKPGVWPWEVA